MQKSQIKNTIWLWGTHAVVEAWKNPKRQIHSLLVTDRMKKTLDSIVIPKDLKRPKIDVVDKHIIDKRLPSGAINQGIAIQCSHMEETFLSDVIIKSKITKNMVIVMLDQVTDPHNVGAIIRSSCAFGAVAIITQSRHAPEITGTLAKAACGAVEHVPIIRVVNLSRAIETLQDNFFNVIGLDEEGQDIAKITKSDHTCLVMGAEGPGLRQKIKENCTSLLRLPTNGPIATLNVSNATAVALYAVTEK